jgi:hypothetical protein
MICGKQVSGLQKIQQKELQELCNRELKNYFRNLSMFSGPKKLDICDKFVSF